MVKQITNYQELYDIWGDVIGGGFTAVPNELLRNQRELGIDPIDMNILINIIRFWWLKERLPYPSMSIMSEETGIGENTINKHISSLHKKGLLKIIVSQIDANSYDLNGLVKRLITLREKRFSA